MNGFIIFKILIDVYFLIPAMELVNKTKRTFCGTAFSASFAIGVCFVALWSYLIRDVTMLQTVFAAHALLLFGHFW